jgi:hypothetical protein
VRGQIGIGTKLAMMSAVAIGACSTSPGGGCTEGSFDPAKWTGTCGTERWAIKTGTDPGAAEISLAAQPTTIQELTSLAQPARLPETRVDPVEHTVYQLTNVSVTFAKLEADSDYHLIVSDGQRTMIVEVPFPGCTADASPLRCRVTRARAATDTIGPSASGSRRGLTATMVGVGFFDFIHSASDGQAPNGIELHPVLAICFEQDCTP